jgi:hypothetical protein
VQLADDVLGRVDGVLVVHGRLDAVDLAVDLVPCTAGELEFGFFVCHDRSPMMKINLGFDV